MHQCKCKIDLDEGIDLPSPFPLSSGKLLALLIIPYDMEPCPGSFLDNKRGKYGINIGRPETDSGQGPRERGRRERNR